MKVSDVFDEIKRLTGNCEQTAVLNFISRAVELLSNTGLFDAQIGYFDFTLDENSQFVALPRAVKTVLRVNINSSPTFARSRVFEFALNSDGSTDDPEAGKLEWSDRGYSPIQAEKKLPGKLRYKCVNPADVGKTIRVDGRDGSGQEITATLSAKQTPDATDDSTVIFAEVLHVFRDQTIGECTLQNGSNIVGKYYADETEPNYRVIKISRQTAAVRIMFRRQVFKVTSLDDFIPLSSEMAVIHAAKAVKYLNEDEYDKGKAALELAKGFIKDEQASRDEGATFSQSLEIQTATARNFNTRDGIIVGDIYDKAAEIFGPVGRPALFDYITTAIELLSNQANWDSLLGLVDIRIIAKDTRNEGGLFVLPRFVETPVAINVCGRPTLPRNKWFEFHLNGIGHDSKYAPCGSWDDRGEVCIINPLPCATERPKLTIPTKIVAVPELADDDDMEVRIYGLERLSDGREIEVWRDDKEGWLCPCENGSLDPGEDAPEFVRIDRITKGESKGFIKLWSLEVTAEHYETLGTSGTANGGNDFTVIKDITRTVIVGDIMRDEAGNTGAILTIVSQDASSVRFTVDMGDGYDPSFDQGFTILTPESFATDILLGHWYPDELEPKYRMIRLPGGWSENRVIHVAYRKRTKKVTSMSEPIPLRSRIAIELMMRAIKMHETDSAAAVVHEGNAIRYLADTRINDMPNDDSLQFDSATMPGVCGNIT